MSAGLEAWFEAYAEAYYDRKVAKRVAPLAFKRRAKELQDACLNWWQAWKLLASRRGVAAGIAKRILNVNHLAMMLRRWRTRAQHVMKKKLPKMITLPYGKLLRSAVRSWRDAALNSTARRKQRLQALYMKAVAHHRIRVALPDAWREWKEYWEIMAERAKARKRRELESLQQCAALLADHLALMKRMQTSVTKGDLVRLRKGWAALKKHRKSKTIITVTDKMKQALDAKMRFRRWASKTRGRRIWKWAKQYDKQGYLPKWGGSLRFAWREWRFHAEGYAMLDIAAQRWQRNAQRAPMIRLYKMGTQGREVHDRRTMILAIYHWEHGTLKTAFELLRGPSKLWTIKQRSAKHWLNQAFVRPWRTWAEKVSNKSAKLQLLKSAAHHLKHRQTYRALYEWIELRKERLRLIGLMRSAITLLVMVKVARASGDGSRRQQSVRGRWQLCGAAQNTC